MPMVTTFASLATLLFKLCPVVMSPWQLHVESEINVHAIRDRSDPKAGRQKICLEVLEGQSNTLQGSVPTFVYVDPGEDEESVPDPQDGKRAV